MSVWSSVVANPTRYEWDHPATYRRFLSHAVLLEISCECIFYDGKPNNPNTPWIRFTAHGFPGVGSKGMVYVHRYVYQMVRGPIPEGHQIDHICRQGDCVNPYHLQALSRSDHAHQSNADKWFDAEENEWF